ncbi:MAG: hypothetical protein AAF399_17175 [Bacteroidota bacterium]
MFAWFVQSLGIVGWILGMVAAMLVVSLLYYAASTTKRNSFREGYRGAMVGINAGLNAWILYQITGWFGVSTFLGGIVFASAFLFVSRNVWYHGLLGWINYFLPMSWLVNVPGSLIFAVNLMFAPLGYLSPTLRPLRIRLYVDLSSGSWTIFGGLIRPLMGFSGLNMGNFIFINPGWEHLLRHEIGHLFSLGALGWMFHYIGGIDEGYVQKNYWQAYAEYLAESYNAPGPKGLTMWR